MNIQDRRGSLTAEELRQKYNLDALVKDRKAIENTTETLTQLNNEQNNMIEAIVLSLSDIELQDNISLWFYNRAPTLENEPSINWEDNETKTEHIGDLYYDRETGYVYQFNYNDELFSWDRRIEANLIQAMALTNAAVDIEDRERKVFLTLPFPPYDNGDWYIKENGDLYICQMSKRIEETYNEYDFIVASKYALGTDAIENNNKIVIIAGQVTTIINSIGLIEQSIEDNKYYVDEEGVKHLISTATSTLKQDVSSIEAEVESIGNILTDFIKNVTHTGDYLMLPDTPKSNGAINTLSIKGFELRELYPGMAYPSEYTYPGVLSFYTLIFDTISTFNNNPHYVYVNSPVPLQKLGSVYDELLIEANKVKVIQRIGYDFDNEQWSVLSTPITHELNDVLLPTFEGDTYISVRYFDNLIYDAEYLIKNDLTSNFATQLESSSQFKLNQNEIEAKVNKDGIISSINLSPEEIKILAERIKIEGLTTINENFKVLLDGSIETVNAKLSGDVFLPDGGRVIGGDGILGNLTASTHRTILGYRQVSHEGVGLFKGYIEVELYIPEMFTIVEAYITIQTFRTRNFYWYPESMEDTDEYGKVQNIKLYKISNNIEVVNSVEFGSFDYDDPSGSEISGAFGADGYTSLTSDGETITSADISNNLDKGFNIFVLKTSNAIPNPSSDAGVLQASKETQFATVTLSVIGYMRSDQE